VRTFILSLLLAAACAGFVTIRSAGRLGPAAERQRGIGRLLAGSFKWRVTPPLVGPAQRTEDPCVSVKDPSIIYFQDRWHLFCTIRSQKRSHQIEYLSFSDWKEADGSPRHILKVTDGYFCAPEVFFFTPHDKWYMIYQVADRTRTPELQPAWSTSTNISDPYSWSKPTLLFSQDPSSVKSWIDFWVICDAEHAHLFFTSLDGNMWRADTQLSHFPGGWSRPTIVLTGDIYEAGHTYRLKGLNKFLTLVEARAKSRRYYKAYIADSLDDGWTALAATLEKPFAGVANTQDSGVHWTDSFSHGELLRGGYDQNLEVDPTNLKFLFQGVTDKEQEGKKYGEIPWRLGILEPRN